MKQTKFWGILMMLVFASTAFVACSDDDDEGSGIPSALVGTWFQQSDTWGWGKGIKLTSSGKAYYDEWNVGDEPDFSDQIPAKAKATKNTLRITHSKIPGYYEEYHYELSEDGKSVTFTLLDWEEEEHGLSGTFTKYK